MGFARLFSNALIVAYSWPQRSGAVHRRVDPDDRTQRRPVTGDLWGEQREPAACTEICPILIAAMDRADEAGSTRNDVKLRIKDIATVALVLMKQGWGDDFGTRHVEIDPSLFDQNEPDATKRDKQINELKTWYLGNQKNIVWDQAANKLIVKVE